jgi:hypothetical protein
MKPTIASSLLILLTLGVVCGCSTSAKPPKPTPIRRQTDGEKALRDSLAHTQPTTPHRK